MPAASLSPPGLADLRRYYDETWLDYRVLWLSRHDYAIHFGYWDAGTRSHADSLNNLNAVLARHIGIQSGMRILDAGCGVGGSAIWLARSFDVDVVGITPVQSQVQRAQRFAQQQGVDHRVRFEQRDYTDTGFADAGFHVVWAMESVCHALDKRRFFEEARRLVVPGGRLGIAEYMRTRRPLPPAAEALLRSWLSGWAIPDIATRDEHHDWAREAGFDQIAVTDLTDNVKPSLRRVYRIATVAWPAALLLRTLRLRSNAQHGNVRGARDQYRALKQGLWFYIIMTATAR